MEPDNSSPQLDYTRLLFNKRSKPHNKLINNNNNTNTSTSTTNNSETLEAIELLKSLLSTQFENEIMQTCDKYMELFQRAGSNIESNQGEAVSQILLNSVIQSMLKSTRNTISRRYSKFKPATNTQGSKIRTLKVVRRKPRTLENRRMDWYKQIRSITTSHTEAREESSNMETNYKPVEMENEIITVLEMKNYRFSHILSLTIVVLFIQLLFNFYNVYMTDENKKCPSTQIRNWVMSLDNPYTVFILILSAGENVERRKAIRETWLNEHKKLANVDYKFVIGNNNEQKLQEQVEKELELFQDIILLRNILESYKMLTAKVVESFKWVNKNIRTDFVLKCDDDSFVLVDHLLETIKEEALPHSRLYWGYFYGRASVKRSGKWAEHEWNICDKYLPFAFGGGYILSSDLVHYIVANSNYLKQYNNEDITIGAWLSTLAITRKHDNRFNTESESRGCTDNYIITHKETPNSMREKYKLYLLTGNICSEEFNTVPGYIYNWNVLPSLCCNRLEGLD
ncbi:Beta-1,3-galactosyltransferase 6 [Oopsacas minuta]|uniref:galactosylxylosylprotein 3-beta-galactosyltransferase n=1 Tax=Oopsacas minuta TaxID=111878 RepID=A0AAV7JVV2_9METZ|nr:Beta-1,3-galactosyltransferase 6 [Oopsacas minuta]